MMTKGKVKKEQSSNLESASRLASSEPHLSDDGVDEIPAKRWEKVETVLFRERSFILVLEKEEHASEEGIGKW